MNNQIICEFCGKPSESQSGFSFHLNKTHGVKPIDYAKKYYTINGDESNSYRIDHFNRTLNYGPNKDYSCLICDKHLTMKLEYIASHVKRIHGVDPMDYIKSNYRYLGDEIDETCGLCLTNPGDYNKIYDIDHKTKTYNVMESPTFICGTDECMNETSMELLGTPYDRATYEFIGSKSEYLSRIHKKDISYVNMNLKRGIKTQINLLRLH